MKKNLLLALLFASTLAGCKKTQAPETPTEQTPAANQTTTAQPEATKPAAELTDAQRELAEKQKLMDYATMEDSYMNDAKAQWAATATASSHFGDTESEVNLTGKTDGKTWTNNNQEIGFDWIELSFEKPVAATEVRLVMPNGNAPESISKVELQDTDGKWNTIWSGISDAKNDSRGNRTWFVKTFPKTAYQVKAVKYTIANNIVHGYKEVDAGQLIGE